MTTVAPCVRDVATSALPPQTDIVSQTGYVRCRFCSLMGQGQQLGSEGDVVGCLRSLRAHAALDGVSWVRSGLVAIAVG